MPWPLFMALLERTARYDARAKLRELDAAIAGAGAMWGGGGEFEAELQRLERVAYPRVKRGQVFALIQSEATEEDTGGE